MAIDIDTFEQTPEDELKELSNPERVLQFLIANDDQAFKASEIASRTGINKNSISTVLNRLEERELVRHKGEYWAIGDEERLRSFDRYQRATERLNERYGREDKDDWRKAAPDESHPDAEAGE